MMLTVAHLLLIGASLNSDAESRDPFPVFMLPDVQSTLKSITGLDLRKIARFCLSPSMERPKYKLLTDGELRQVDCVVGFST